MEEFRGKKVDSQCRVAFKGLLGSCCEESALGVFGHHKNLLRREEEGYCYIDTVACKNFREVFNRVVSREVHYGMVKIEDWSKGTVTAALDELLKKNVKIVAELICKRDLHLVEILSSSSDSSKVFCILVDRSAFVACKKFLKEILGKHCGSVIALVDDIVSSCSYVRRSIHGRRNEEREIGSSAIFSEDSESVFLELDPTSDRLKCQNFSSMQERNFDILAVANKRCASLFCLDVGEACNEDGLSMISKYVVIRNYSEEHADSELEKALDKQSKGVYKTSISFSIPNEPLALYKALFPFASRGVNICKLESRPGSLKTESVSNGKVCSAGSLYYRPPSKNRLDQYKAEHTFDYITLIETDGDMSNSDVKSAVRELEEFTYGARILGSYPCIVYTRVPNGLKFAQIKYFPISFEPNAEKTGQVDFISQLPHEIATKILALAAPNSKFLVSFQLVSKSWHNTCGDSRTWKYFCEKEGRGASSWCSSKSKYFRVRTNFPKQVKQMGGLAGCRFKELPHSFGTGLEQEWKLCYSHWVGIMKQWREGPRQCTSTGFTKKHISARVVPLLNSACLLVISPDVNMETGLIDIYEVRSNMLEFVGTTLCRHDIQRSIHVGNGAGNGNLGEIFISYAEEHNKVVVYACGGIYIFRCLDDISLKLRRPQLIGHWAISGMQFPPCTMLCRDNLLTLVGYSENNDEQASIAIIIFSMCNDKGGNVEGKIIAREQVPIRSSELGLDDEFVDAQLSPNRLVLATRQNIYSWKIESPQNCSGEYSMEVEWFPPLCDIHCASISRICVLEDCLCFTTLDGFINIYNCLRRENQTLWNFANRFAYYRWGPAPFAISGSVFITGTADLLNAVDWETKESLWTVDHRQELGKRGMSPGALCDIALFDSKLLVFYESGTLLYSFD
eukprot:Nk52_evm77s1444 gene=Nk52_evmTU77s1444